MVKNETVPHSFIFATLYWGSEFELVFEFAFEINDDEDGVALNWNLDEEEEAFFLFFVDSIGVVVADDDDVDDDDKFL